MNRIDLIQDFHMPNYSTHIKVTPDGKYALACGSYPPTVKIFELDNLSVKHTRGFNSLPIKCEPISDDWTKFAVLGQDKTVDLQYQGGNYHKLALPRVPRDITYDKYDAMLYVVGDSSKVFRMDLEVGCWANSIDVNRETTINTAVVNSELNLLLIGTADGAVEAWDARSAQPAFVNKTGNFNVTQDGLCSVEKLATRHLNVISGDAQGNVRLWDVRKRQELYTHSNEYIRLQTNTVGFHSCNEKHYYYYANNHYINVVNMDDTGLGENIESTVIVDHHSNYNEYLSHVEFIPDSGMLMTAGQGAKMGIYYIPKLGKTPNFAKYLESVTEELEENEMGNKHKAREVFVGMTFLDKNALNELNALSLIGTNSLKPHMHGYFIDTKLYKELRQNVSDESETKTIALKKEKLDKLYGEKIVLGRKSVNDNYFNHISEIVAKNRQLNDTDNDKFFKKAKHVENIIQDSRFGQVFQDKDFLIKDDEQEKFNKLSKKIKDTEINDNKEVLTVIDNENNTDTEKQSNNNGTEIDHNDDDDNTHKKNKETRIKNKENTKQEKIVDRAKLSKLNNSQGNKVLKPIETKDSDLKRKRDHIRKDTRVQMSNKWITKNSINKSK